MKNKTIDIVLVILITSIFFAYFTYINVFVKNDMMESMKLVEDYARNEEWNRVLEVSKDIEEIWNKQKYIIMFNFGDSEFSDFEHHINYIIAGAEGKQLDSTLSNILSAQDTWKNFKRIAPEP